MSWLSRFEHWPFIRFVKFGIVGASGTVVNLTCLALAQEFLFVGIEDPDWRLRSSLAFAIFIATINNFYWNHLWTWADRERQIKRNRFIQFLQYTAASWVGISIQFILTPLLSNNLSLHYTLANIIAIAMAAVVNFLINDRWTFWIQRRKQREQ